MFDKLHSLINRFRKRRQRALIFTGFGGVTDDSLVFVEGKPYAANHRILEAFGVSEDNMTRDRRTGKRIQLLVAWNYKPVRLFGPEIKDTDISTLAARMTDESIVWETEKQRKNTMVLWFGIIAGLLALGIVIPILNAVFSRGG